MKKWIALTALLAFAGAAYATVTADVIFKVENMKQNNVRLHADFRLLGIKKGEVFKYEFRWTAPEGGYLIWPGSKGNGRTSSRCFEIHVQNSSISSSFST